jgi:hypothetical protein
MVEFSGLDKPGIFISQIQEKKCYQNPRQKVPPHKHFVS